MKFLAALIITLVVVLCGMAEAYHRSMVPAIVAQRDGEPGHILLTVENPNPKAVWVYIECPTVVTIAPIGIRGRSRTVIDLSSSESDELKSEKGRPCLMDHWKVQDTQSPKPWSP